MNKINYLLLNLFLSIAGIYLTYFYFGTRVYHYPLYELSQIFKSSILVSLLLVLPLIILNLILKKFSNQYFKKTYNSLIFGGLIFIIYHYAFKFIDINYYYLYATIFKDQNIFIQIIFYIFPVILSSIIYFKLSKNIIKKINYFIFITLITFNTISINRVIQIYGMNKNEAKSINDLKSFKHNNKKKITYNKKIFFLVFDTFDQFYLEKNIDNLDNLKNLYKTSYVNRNFYTPAKFTLDSIPAILTGNSTKKTVVTIDGLYFYNLENKKIKFNQENSIFYQKNIKGFKSSIFGFYHPYCRVFKIDNCYDIFNFNKRNIGLINAFDIIFRITYVDKFFNPLALVIKKESSNVKIENIDTNLLSKFMYENSKNFINVESDLIFIHYPYPHPPLKTKGILKNEVNNLNLSDYEKNLFLIDLTISKIQSSLDKYNNSLLIITSDHWFKEGHTKDKAHPSVFFSKIIGDDNFIEDTEPKNLSSIKKLITDYLNDKIKTNYDIKNFFKKETNHVSFVR